MENLINILNYDFSQAIGSSSGFNGPEQWTLKTPLDMGNDAIHKAFLSTMEKVNQNEDMTSADKVWVFTRGVLEQMAWYAGIGHHEVYDSAVIDRPTN
jgi:hypothetical protein